MDVQLSIEAATLSDDALRDSIEKLLRWDMSPSQLAADLEPYVTRRLLEYVTEAKSRNLTPGPLASSYWGPLHAA